ncbi:MAG: WG repeat-containing protein [Clostridia bacterium]|nr:WG repeat-containing protein [Clostridia bacterium]
MAKGRRYDSEPKLNIKKVIGVIIAFVVLIMIITSIVKILKNNPEEDTIRTSSYYPVYTNGKWGVIDNNGEMVISATYDEMIVIPNNKKPVFVCTYDVQDSTSEYKTKVLNEKNEEILKGYDKIEAIDNYDSKQNIWFEDNLLRVKKNGKYGLIDFNGKTVLECEYDTINSLKGVTENIIIEKDGKVGLVNAKGQTIIKTEYASIQTLKEGYKSEYLAQNAEGKYGIISTSGTVILEPKYDEIKYLDSNETYAVKLDGTMQLVNNKGELLQTSEGEEYVYAKGENVIVSKDGKVGIEKLTGEQVIGYDYEELKYAFSIYYIAKKDGKYGIINVNNETIKEFEYTNMYWVEEGNFIVADKTEIETVIFDNNLSQKIFGIVSEINVTKGYIKMYTGSEYKYYNFKFEEKPNTEILSQNTLFLSKKDGKYGFTDKAGNVVVDYIYEDATEQNSCGYVAVKQNGVWGSLKRNGSIALNPSVNLDNSIYIDFIGEWHLSDDGLYYTK